MTSIFVSYSRDDELRAASLIKALRQEGYDVWWDKDLPASSEWRSEIERAISDAALVIVCWSETSIGSKGSFVKDEASRAGSKLVQVLIDKVSPPLGFGELQAIDLHRWGGSRRDPFYQDLVHAIKAKLEGSKIPPPKGPSKSIYRKLLYRGGGSVFAISLIGFALSIPSVQTGLCRVSQAIPYSQWACCNLGVVDKVSVPSGRYVAQSRSIQAYLRQSEEAFSSKAAAEQDAAVRAIGDAKNLCSNTTTNVERLVSSSASIGSSECRQIERGWFCGLNYIADCQLEVPEQILQCSL